MDIEVFRDANGKEMRRMILKSFGHVKGIDTVTRYDGNGKGDYIHKAKAKGLFREFKLSKTRRPTSIVIDT